VSNDFRVGSWIVRPSLNSVSQNGTSTRLEPKVMEVLVCLASQPGEPVPKEAILKTVWPETFVSDDVLIRSVSELRRVFDDDAREPRYIETIPKRGYRLVAPVTPANGSAANTSLPAAEYRREAGKRNWKIAWLSVTGLVLLCGLLVGFNIGDLRAHIFGAHPPIHSLAVLPLKNLSDDPSQIYFASGMTEELITDLSQISALKVISRTSSDQYEGSHKSLPEIARELHVDAIIEGSVVRSGNRVRITAQLIYAPEDKNLWARSYERDVQDALALQRALANAIADEVRVQVSPQEQERLHPQHPVSPTLLENYLEGNYHLHRGALEAVDEEHQKAEKYFQLAIDEDPSFAPAYIGLAYAHGLILSGSGIMNPSPRDYEIRKAAAEKAAALAPQSSEAHELLGNVAAEDWRWSDAEEELQRAIALSPNRAQAHDALAFFFCATGRMDEAHKEIHIAQELDPKSDRLWGILFDEGKYDEAIQLQINDLQRQPDDGYAHYGLFQTYALAGRYPESIHELGEAGKLLGFAELAPGMNDAFRAGGFKAAVRSVAANMERLQKAGQVYIPDILAEFYGVIGDKDRAFYWLEDAYRHKHSTGAGGGLVWLKGNPMYASLRSDPRYADLVRRVGLPP
jgi:TolB-like protein/DNA-binding winged helix-turn-helix (wHTH) protein